MDHVLFHGPPGLGKTTLASIVAQELGVNIKFITGPMLNKAGDLAAILTNLQEKDVLFIDEIHRLNINVEEVLYSAMEDFSIDVIIGEGNGARTMKIKLKPFTLIGATTRIGLLSNPLRTRFGIPMHMNFYDNLSLAEIVTQAAKVINAEILESGAYEISKRSRGTPRIALRILKRINDFATVQNIPIDDKITNEAMLELGIDENGFDESDIAYLKLIGIDYSCGPVGIDTISAALSQERDTIEETIEPYLLQQGFIGKTPRGRVLTKKAMEYLGIIRSEDSLF